MALFDTAHRNLYVACTGDSRAVAGVWEETADGKGHWRVDVLTEDQTGRNPNELKRSVLLAFINGTSEMVQTCRFCAECNQNIPQTRPAPSSCADVSLVA